MADSSKIALMLELQLAAKPALETLGIIETKFTNIEKMVMNIGKSVADWSKPMVDALSQAGKVVVDDVKKANTPTLPSDLEGGPKEAKAIAEIGDGLKMIVYDIVKWRKELVQVNGDLGKLALAGHYVQDEVLKIGKAVEDLTSGDRKKLEVALSKDDLVKDGKALQSLDELMDRHYKNSHQLRKATKDVWDTISEGAGEANNSIDAIINGMIMGFSALTIVLGVINPLLKLLTKEQDEFVKANYRASGSMVDLQSEMRLYQSETSASGEQAMKAGQAIYMAGIHGVDAHKILIPQVIKLTAAYGISEEAAASYAASVMSVGGSAAEVSVGMEFAAKAISFAGLSSAEATTLFQKLGKSMFEIFAQTGSREAAKQFSENFAMITAAARNAQVDINDVQDSMVKIGKGGVDMVRMLGGAAISGTQNERMVAGLNKASQVMKATEGMADGVRAQIVEAMTGMSLTSVANLDLTANKVREYTGVTGDLLDEHYKAYNDHIKSQESVTESYHEVLSTLTGTVKDTLIPVFNLLMTALVPIAKIFVFLLTPIVTIIKAFTELYTVIASVIGVKVMPWLIGIAGAMLLLSTSMAGPLIALGAIAAAFKVAKYFLESTTWWVKLFGIALTAVISILVLFQAQAMLAGKGLTGAFAGARVVFLGITSGIGAVGKGLLNLMTSIPGVGKFFNKLGEAGTSVFEKLSKKGGIFGKIFDKFTGGGSEKDAKSTIIDGAKDKLKDNVKEKVELPDEKKGEGFKGFMKNLKEGLTDFGKGAGAILKGAFTFAAAMLILVAPIVLLAWVSKSLGLSAVDFAVAVGVLAVGIVAFKVLMAAITATTPLTTAAILPIVLISVAIAILGAALIPAAYAAKLFGEAIVGTFKGLADIGIGKLALTLIAFAAATLMLIPAGIALAVFGAELLIANALILAAMVIFPNKWFHKMATDMQTFTDAISKLPPSIGDTFRTLRVEIQALGSMAKVDLSEVLTSDIISGEDNFIKAADIIHKYATSVVGDLQRLSEAYAPTMSAVLPIIDTKKETPKRSATKDKSDLTVVEQKKTNELLAKSLEEMKSSDSSLIVETLVKLNSKVDDLIEVSRRRGETHSASQW